MTSKYSVHLMDAGLTGESAAQDTSDESRLVAARLSRLGPGVRTATDVPLPADDARVRAVASVRTRRPESRQVILLNTQHYRLSIGL